ncbi:MAG: PEGA domain-containing protein, partial [Myxococcales bacterium]|nr:PEGA domain-containing protein [Myxococcales bacterium]
PATDVYGLGATLYHALTGRPPFESDSRFVLMAAHVTTAPKAPSEILAETGRSIPPPLEAVILRCLRKEPSERYQSMAELGEALAEALGENAPDTMRASLPSGVSERRARPTATSEIDALAETVEPAEKPASPFLWGGLGLVALAAAGVAVAFAAGVFDAGPPPAATSPRAQVVPAPAAQPTPDPPPTSDGPAPETPPAAAAREVTVSVLPENATLHRGEDDLGNSPLTIEVPEGERWEIEVRAPGHVPRTITLTGAQREVNVQLERRRRTAPTGSADQGSTSGRRRSDNRDPWAEDSP